ncbi:MAG: hypothetical protein KF795_05910 [Labilithrix sp.]|nr:hypothetical protein [Labilithrix sp.]
MPHRLLPFPRALTTTFFSALLTAAVGAGGCTTTTVVKNDGTSGAAPAGQERRESIPCKSGDTTLPIEAFDISSDEATGAACNVGNVLDDDGSFAALDWQGGGTHKLDGRDVTGCLAAEFGDDITLSSLSMKMRPVGTGCGHACTPGDEGCGSGWKVSIFAGPSIAKLGFLQQLSLTTGDFFEYRIAVYDRFKAKFIAICREPTPAEGDDVAIDSIYGFCR